MGELVGAAPLLVREGSGGWRPPQTRAYGTEADLQALLAGQPALLPAAGSDAVAVRELHVPEVGPVDIVAVNPAGEITLAECKLGSNPEIRRHVVGQLLAYASGLWRLDVARFDSAWKSRDGGRGVLEAVLGEPAEGEDRGRLHGALGANLKAGRFNLVLAVDAITPELQRIIEYLNAHTLDEVSVLALELTYAREGQVEIVVPRVFGEELAAARGPSRSPWDEASLLEAVAQEAPDAAGLVRGLLDHYRDRVERFYWGRGATPSVTAVFRAGDTRVQPWSVYTGQWLGVAVNFQWMQALGDERRVALLERLRAIPGAAAKLEGVEQAGFAKRPSLPLTGVLDQPGAMHHLIAAIDDALTDPVDRSPRQGSAAVPP